MKNTSTKPSLLPRRAWASWAGFVAGSSVAMLAVLPLVDSVQINAEYWFIVPLLWLAMAVPATVGVYGQCFRSEWLKAGEPAAAGDTLRGLRSIWAVLSAGVGLSLVACVLAGSASPGIWPGALMLMLLILARPPANLGRG